MLKYPNYEKIPFDKRERLLFKYYGTIEETTILFERITIN